MTKKYTNRAFLDVVDERVIIFDGAMGPSLQSQNLTAEHFGGERYNGCNNNLAITYPQAVEAVHRSFLEVGVDVIETNTFRANRITLDEYGLGDQTLEINRSAAIMALLNDGVDVIGKKCLGGPAQVYRIIQKMKGVVPDAVFAVKPNAGWPEQVGEG